MQTTTRNANLEDLTALLRDQHGRKVDIVAPADKIRSDEAQIVVKGSEPILTPDGVTDGDGRYIPTLVADEGISEKLNVPIKYLRRMREERPDLYDANLNGWLRGRRAKVSLTNGEAKVIREAIPGDSRSFLVRGFRGDDGGPGVLRAFLSDSYSIMDNLDVLMAALDGIQQAGVAVEIDGCDLSDRRMYVRVKSPEVQALAPELLRGYRSPFSGAEGSDNPTVFAGFQIGNSETGCGAFSIVPRLVVQVCNNGMTMTRDAIRKVHLGSRMDEGIVSWSKDTQEKNLALVTAQARDSVQAFLSPGYLTKAIARLEAVAGAEITEPAEQIKVLAKRLQYTQEQANGILDHFIKGGVTTAGGVMHAVTSYAQTVSDGDVAADLEASAERVLHEAAALVR